MAKYSKQHLKEIAIRTISLEGTAQYLNGIMQLAIKTGLYPSEVERRIRNIANNY